MKKSNVTHEGGKRNEAASALKETHRGRVKSDFPKHTLDEALRVARALSDKNGGQPLPPTETAIAIGISPGSSEFRTLLSSSIKYGLTTGSFNSEKVVLEDAGRNIVEPRNADDEQKALVKAALNPPTFKSIFDYLRAKKLPDDMFFQNTLVREFSVPRDHAAKCAAVFTKNMERVGLVHMTTSGKWLSTGLAQPASEMPIRELKGGQANGATTENAISKIEPNGELPISSPNVGDGVIKSSNDPRLNRVFVTHGKNMALINPIKELLSFGELEAIISVERESVAQVVSDKVMNDMRTCGAGIIHIDDDVRLVDEAEKEHVFLNPNVLIEIGVAMALYGHRYIFLVKEGVDLPSNLQGLYKVRYSGDRLDGEVTLRLLKAINEMKKQTLPESGRG
jgi:hypothetical protein